MAAQQRRGSTAAELAEALGARRSGEGWSAKCPAHDDTNPSLSISDRNGRVLVHCHAGCPQRAVTAALRDLGLWAVPPATARALPSGSPDRSPDRVWVYTDATGEAVRRTARWDTPGGKVVRPQSPAGRGGWRAGDMKGRRPLYNLSNLIERPGALVVVVEGEPAADAAQTMLPDYVVTTSAGGALAAARTDWSPVRDRAVVVWPDADTPGAQYAADVARLTRAAAAADVRVIHLPALPDGWDLADPLPDGWTHDTVRDLVRSAPAAGGDATIDVTDLDLRVVSARAWAELERANEPPRLFSHGALPVRLEQADTGEPVLRPLTESRLRHELARASTWTKQKVKGAAATVAPPKEVVQDMLAHPRPPLPALTRIIEAPTFARDGSLVTQHGYNAPGRLYYAPVNGFGVPTVPRHPTDADIDRARALILDDLIGDFPFTQPAEKTNALALLVSPFVREMIDGPVPLSLIEKPAAGTGGTLLATVPSWLTTGRDAAVMTEGRDEDEWRKRITATLIDAPPVVLIDNLRRRLDSSALAGAITAVVWTDRILGRSENTRLPVRSVWIGTGNNPTLSNEIARRTVRVRLDAKTDRPWQRNGFRHPDLRAWTLQNRGELVWAVLTMVQAWIAAGRPPGAATLGMFESWAAVLSGVLETVGVAGFLTNSEELYEAADADSAAWRALVAIWWDRHHGNTVGVAELWRILSGEDGEAVGIDLGRGSERSQRTRFGVLLGQQRDRQFGEFRVVTAGIAKRAQQWRLERCGG